MQDLEKIDGLSAFKEIVYLFPVLDGLLGFPTGTVGVTLVIWTFLLTTVVPQGKLMTLSKEGCPEALSWWINRGCKVQPDIKDPAAFGRALMSWWSSLQPKSRRREGTDKLLQVVQ